MVSDKIQVLGLDDFNTKEKNKILDYADNYAEKIFREINADNMVIHAKKHDKAGKRAKYSFHVRIRSPTNLITAKDDDWILATALHKVFEKVKNEAQHTFKTKGHNYVRK